MGNWHCVPSSCATVEYREYLHPLVRWRYGAEPWQEIEGSDDFSTKLQEDLSLNTDYVAVYKDYYHRVGIWSQERRTFGAVRCNGVDSWSLQVTNQNNVFYLDSSNAIFKNTVDDDPTAFEVIADFQVKILSKGIIKTILVGSANGIEILRIEPKSPALLKQNCLFKVTKKGQVVHQETRSTCPQIEKIPCQLSDQIKQIEIDKLPLLEKIEVVPYQYSAYKLPGIPSPIAQADPIPSQCLNIYNNAIYVIPLPTDALKYPDAIPFDSFIQQICSSPGCLPPEYQVICDCRGGCESCPDGTCPIQCGDHVCCYNDYGVSIKEIPLADYCGWNNL